MKNQYRNGNIEILRFVFSVIIVLFHANLKFFGGGVFRSRIFLYRNRHISRRKGFQNEIISFRYQVECNNR